MNRLFVDFTVYDYSTTDNHTHAFVCTETNTLHIASRITKASRRRIERLVRNAPELGLAVSVNISDLSMFMVLSNAADEEREAAARLEEYLRG